MPNKIFLLLSISLTFFKFCFGQETIGVPDISNFLHEEMNAGSQSWQIAQDKKGYIYFANNSGLLYYNNKEWKLFPLPNRTIVRSLSIADDGKIYVGGQDDFGYFFPNRNGHLVFYSLTDLLAEEDRSFGDVWNIIINNERVFFRTSRKVFAYYPKREGKIIRYDAVPGRNSWSFMTKSNNILYAQNGAIGLVYFDNNKWKTIDTSIIKKTLVTSILPFKGDTLLISTLRNGLFLMSNFHIWPFTVDPAIKRSQIYSTCNINDSIYAMGTVSNGIFFINRNGQTIRHFNSENGMQNNNILSLFIDDQENLWAGLDEGIVRINYNSPIKIIPPVYKQKIPVYAIQIFNNTLYTGTSDGIYINPLSVSTTSDIGLSKAPFYRIDGSEGQVWNLNDVNGRVLVGHHDGTFVIEKNKLKLLGREGGGSWLFRPLQDSNSILTGSYAGIQNLVNTTAGLVTKPIPGNTLKESLRFVEIDFDSSVVWASHPYRGIYKLKMSPGFNQIVETKLLTSNEGLPSNNNNYVFKINGEIVFATENGIYQYNWKNQKFKVHEKYFALFGQTPVRFMTSDKKGRIWFATEKRMGVAEKGTVNYIPELDGMLVARFEHIYPYNDENIFAAGYKGIIHINYKQYTGKKTKLSAWLNKVVTFSNGDSVLNEGYFVHDNKIQSLQNKNSVETLAPRYNSFHFEFAANQFGQSASVQYSYKLIGFDNNWSLWTEKKEKDYTNLSYGTYTFEVKARDNFGNESAAASYSFKIAPKWYQTRLIKAGYLLSFLLTVWGVNRMHKKRLERQRIKFVKEEAQLRHLHELELEHNEKEIVQLKNERLEAEVDYKNKELASTTMHLYKRGRLLGKIKEELADATKNLNSREERTHFNKLVKLIAEEEKRDSDWEQFAYHFDQVHNRFLHNIKEKYPNLTPADLKISAYLKMNLSSKEIAQLLNISLKGVEIARHRLRKKLQLESSVNLTDFIMNVS